MLKNETKTTQYLFLLSLPVKFGGGGGGVTTLLQLLITLVPSNFDLQ